MVALFTAGFQRPHIYDKQREGTAFSASSCLDPPIEPCIRHDIRTITYPFDSSPSTSSGQALSKADSPMVRQAHMNGPKTFDACAQFPALL